MIYEDNSSIPKRGVPLNGLADKSAPGGSSAISITEQWGAVSRRSIALGSVPLYGIPQEATSAPAAIEQWGAVPRRGFPIACLSLYGIPQNCTYVPPVPPTPPVSAGGGGGVIMPERYKEPYRDVEREARILRDDEEILELLSLITPMF